MDVPRSKSVARNRKIRRVVYGVLALAVVAGVTLGVSRLKPAAPTVESGTVWPGTVKQGQMLRQVRGLGTLVPEEIVWIPAGTSGRVDKRLAEPGKVVTPDTVLFELSNPELQQQLMDAEAQVRSSEAEYVNRKVELESQLLNQQAQAAAVQSEYKRAKLEADAYEPLVRQGLYSELLYKRARTSAEELAVRNEIEQKRIALNTEAMKSQLAVQQASLEQRRGMVDLRRKQVADLRVRAGMRGVLQQIVVEVGQQLTPGTNLARVANPTKLKAQVRIAETQAKDVQIGQRVEIDTRNGIIPGHVTRIDPIVQQGTVTIDVALDGALPPGARQDLSVDGTVELERLENVLYVERPAFGQEKSTVTLFKYEPDGKHANRVQVKFGRSSVNHIEILEGLRVGDKVILSDTSAWDSYNRIRLN